MEGRKGPQYSNWVSYKIVGAGALATLILLLAARFTVKQSHLIAALLLVGMFIALAMTFYMARARTALSYERGGVQGMVLDGVKNQLKKAGWDGRGKVLDIGCGSGALSIKIAKDNPRARVTGIDYWGSQWDYSQALCESNAKIEGVSARVEFRKGDAAKLPYLDGVFDAAVSNFVFHKVRTQPDKLALVKEALRVVKPGGYFAFEDVFYSKRVYGDMDKFVEALKPYVDEIHFEDMRKPDYAPKFLNTPLILGQMGMIWGRKSAASNKG